MMLAKQPVLYDLTLYGTSSGFMGDLFLYGGWADEGEDAVFWTDLTGAEPMGYQWFRMYPWEINWVQVAGATNWYFTITNVDSWVDWTEVCCLVSNAVGEVLWLGPAEVVMVPRLVHIPATNYANGQGPASRYPMTINVFGMPTNFDRVSVTVTLCGLSHSRSADMNILLVSPLGKQVMLMSSVGGTNSVANATIAFRQDALPHERDEPAGQP